MADQGILGMFASHAFLSGLRERHLMVLASGARAFRVEEGELLGREGEPANAFYLIQSGHVSLATQVPSRGLVDVQTVGPGEVIGWSWLVPPHRWQFDARALDHVEGVSFNGTWLREMCEQDYELGYHLLRHLLAVLAGRLTATRLRLLAG
jgi:CRP/FNR family cyclic AMP-dependent transcriptional regulator